MSATGVTMGLAEWIIGDTCLVEVVYDGMCCNVVMKKVQEIYFAFFQFAKMLLTVSKCHKLDFDFYDKFAEGMKYGKHNAGWVRINAEGSNMKVCTLKFFLNDPSGLGRIGGHYFHAW